ncbi:MAG: penicillin acylase family protein [Pseudomonadota bacterium]
MRLILTWLLRAVAALAGIGALAAAIGFYLVSRSLPDYGARIAVDGLLAEATIIRDRHAIPHIRAANEQDAFFALGLAHAQDRLWQMELSRRTAQGRLSTLLGERTTGVDRLMKTLDLYGHASRSLAYQTPEARAALEAYADGVNAWLGETFREARGRGAPELFLFGREGIAPWTPADSLSILKVMALRLSGAAGAEIRRARLLLALPPERVADILPDPPEGATVTVPRYAELYPGARFAAADAPLPERDPLIAAVGTAASPELAGASNAWAVDGSRSALGRPLLASDPHLWLSAPSVWYLADVQGGAMAAMGGTLPGVPLVLIGHNRTLGWGLTTVGADDADIYIEQLDPEDPTRYRTPDGWADFDTRRILIERDGASDVIETVRISRHGPVLDRGLLGAEAITPEGHVAALRWTALTDEDTSFSAGFALMRAPDVDTAVAAAAGVRAPAQNIVMADTAGNIALVTAGALPRRKPESPTQGRVPSPGWLPETAWDGMLPFEEAPQQVNPRSGAVANANNRTSDSAFPDHIAHDWDLPYRILRIEKELKAREFHSMSGFLALQSDGVSEMARAMLPLIARDLWWRRELVSPQPSALDTQRAEALALLGAWEGAMDRHRPEPLIFAEWMRQLTIRIAADELGPLLPLVEGIRPLFIERAFRDVDGAAIWCDIDKTPEAERCQEMAAVALDDALARLTRDYGANIAGWRWGAAHVAHQRHMPLGYVEPIGFLFSLRQESSGGFYTVLRGAWEGRGERPFDNVHAAGLRMVLDFADLDRSRIVISTGQSGHPLSRHYDDMANLWVRGETVAMSMDDETARLGALGTTRLRPAR